VPLNFARGCTAVSGLYDKAQDRQTHGVAKGT
jgi:hypothetical protein